MNELPELPFEQVLSYLSLENLIKARAVSRAWYHRINSFRVKSLCYSDRPSGFIWGKPRWVSGAFAQNFINSTRFASFFATFGQTILANLKYLRLCDLELNKKNQAAFAGALNSFGQLQELDIIQLIIPFKRFELNLPMLRSIHLNGVYGIKQLILDAPRLKRVKIQQCPKLKVDLVHAESVERLLVDEFQCYGVKNLKYLHIQCSTIDVALLSSLKQLKEIHLCNWYQRSKVLELFEQKKRSGRAELKVYFRGLLLSGPEDPAIGFLRQGFDFNENVLRSLVENPSRLADEIVFQKFLCYTLDIEKFSLNFDLNVLKRFTDLDRITVISPVQNVQRFLNLLKHENIVSLKLSCAQQDVLDRLPETIQRLDIRRGSFDFQFLFRLKNLLHLYLHCSIDAETVRRLFEELPYLSKFTFTYYDRRVEVKADHLKQFCVTVDDDWTKIANPNDLVQLLTVTHLNQSWSL